jgi:O-succinylbenzoic acid--CoA ligase
VYNVDFDSKGPLVLCHNQYQEMIPKILKGLSSYDLQDHFILFSSGTTGGNLKGYAVSKQSLFTNAKAFNEHYGLSSKDIWALSLPTYHIGGLSVLARCRLLNNKLIETGAWEPVAWLSKIEEATITTIVPTQLYDLVKLKLRPSKNLRYIIVGGDFLSSELKKEAIELGWPVIVTFGMSEVCSQLAASFTPKSEVLNVMPIHKVKTNADSRLLVKSESLFTLQFRLEDSVKVTMSRDLCDEDGYYLTSDSAIVTDNTIKHLGRLGDDFKVAGHLINLKDLKDRLSTYLLDQGLYGKMELQLDHDERKGKKLTLFTLPNFDEHFPQVSEILKPVKLDEIQVVENFERTSLGKFKKQKA